MPIVTQTRRLGAVSMSFSASGAWQTDGRFGKPIPGCKKRACDGAGGLRPAYITASAEGGWDRS